MRSIAAFLSMLATASMVYPQTIEPPKISRSIFKFSSLHLAQSAMKVGVETFNRDFTESILFFVNGKIDSYRENLSRNADYGLVGEFQFRRYTFPMQLYEYKKEIYTKGAYWSFFLQSGYYRKESTGYGMTFDHGASKWTIVGVQTDYVEEIVSSSLGFLIGFQRTFWDVIFMDAFIGGGLQLSNVNVHGRLVPDYARDSSKAQIGEPDCDGLMVKFGVNIGLGL